MTSDKKGKKKKRKKDNHYHSEEDSKTEKGQKNAEYNWAKQNVCKLSSLPSKELTGRPKR